MNTCRGGKLPYSNSNDEHNEYFTYRKKNHFSTNRITDSIIKKKKTNKKNQKNKTNQKPTNHKEHLTFRWANESSVVSFLKDNVYISKFIKHKYKFNSLQRICTNKSRLNNQTTI